MDEETVETYRTMVSLASEGLNEYLAVVAELQDASVLSGHISASTAENATRWAAEITQFVTEKMNKDGVVPHYYIVALIDILYTLGVTYLSEGFEGVMRDKFMEEFA